MTFVAVTFAPQEAGLHLCESTAKPLPSKALASTDVWHTLQLAPKPMLLIMLLVVLDVPFGQTTTHTCTRNFMQQC